MRSSGTTYNLFFSLKISITKKDSLNLVYSLAANKVRRNPGGGGTPLYQVYRYVPPQRIWFLSRFGLKTGIDFEHFGLKLGMVIGGTLTKAYKLIFLSSNRGE